MYGRWELKLPLFTLSARFPDNGLFTLYLKKRLYLTY